MRDFTFISDSAKAPHHQFNEDRTLVVKAEEYNLFILFDGVSTAMNAISAIEKIVKYIEVHHCRYRKNGEFNLRRLIFDANSELIKSNIIEPYTTCSALYVPISEKENIKYVNLGDSRIYGVSKKYIHQYTKDDNDLLRKNIITKSIGMTHLQKVDFKENTIKYRDEMLLICSDGFYKLLESDKRKFHGYFLEDSLNSMKSNLNEGIKGKNNDDSTYILIHFYV